MQKNNMLDAPACRLMLANIVSALFLLLLARPGTGIVCKICRHTNMSVAPPNAPNSLLIFDGIGDNCEDEDILCAPEEEFCVSSWTKVAGRHWVQKGCIASAAGGKLRGCTEEVLDFSSQSNLPNSMPVQNLPNSVPPPPNLPNSKPPQKKLSIQQRSQRRRQRSPGKVGDDGQPMAVVHIEHWREI